jgi:hypothetical protein
MSHGTKVVFLVFGTIILAYVLTSSLPVLRELISPRPATPVPVTLAAAQQRAAALPHAGPAPLPAPQVRPTIAPPAQLPGISISQMGFGIIPAGYGSGSPNETYAQHSVVLLREPDGTPLIPTSLNRAPLVVRRGTRVLIVQRDGEWAMVQTPGRMLGWVAARELGPVQPYSVDHN